MTPLSGAAVFPCCPAAPARKLFDGRGGCCMRAAWGADLLFLVCSVCVCVCVCVCVWSHACDACDNRMHLINRAVTTALHTAPALQRCSWTRGRAVPDMGLPVLCCCVLVIRATTYEYAQRRMSMHVYWVLVVRARTHEYGPHHMYVGGFFTGNRPPVFPPRRFTTLLCLTSGV